MRNVTIDFLYLQHNGEIERYTSAHMDKEHEAGEYTSDFLSYFGFDTSEVEDIVLFEDHILLDVTVTIDNIENTPIVNFATHPFFVGKYNPASFFDIFRCLKNFYLPDIDIKTSVDYLYKLQRNKSEVQTIPFEIGTAIYYNGSFVRLYIAIPKNQKDNLSLFLGESYDELTTDIRNIGTNWSLCSQAGHLQFNLDHLNAMKRRHWFTNSHGEQIQQLEALIEVVKASEYTHI